MKSVITLVVTHSDKVSDLAEKIAGRAHTIQHVTEALVHAVTTSNDLIALPVIEMKEEVKS